MNENTIYVVLAVFTGLLLIGWLADLEQREQNRHKPYVEEVLYKLSTPADWGFHYEYTRDVTSGKTGRTFEVSSYGKGSYTVYMSEMYVQLSYQGGQLLRIHYRIGKGHQPEATLFTFTGDVESTKQLIDKAFA
jgi:hypothetical protein